MKLTCQQIATYLGCAGEFLGEIVGFKQESRSIEPGDLFFAMKGERVDGHSFLQEVAERGARGAVVSSAYRGEAFGLQLFRVEDVLASLQSLAKQVHALQPPKVIAVTGSVGKTTTKEFIVTLLEGSFRVGKTPGNANSQVGVPLSILNAKGDEEVFVAEMGMTGKGEIETLVSIIPPDIAVVTKVVLCHAVYFQQGLEGIAAAKAEIFSNPFTKMGILSHQALAFPPFKHLSSKTFSYALEGEDADFVLCRRHGQFLIKEGSQETPLFPLPFSAYHLLENFMGAAVVARWIGLPWVEIARRAQQLRPFAKRFEQIEKEGIVFMNDSYNANPTSMRAALDHLPEPGSQGKRIAVLGAMKELGPYTASSHIEVAELAALRVDHLLCLGEECLPMVEVFCSRQKPAEHFLELASLKRRVFELANKGDVVLLKGSKSNCLWEVLE